MTARESSAVANAAAYAIKNPAISLSEVARKYEIALSSLRRALRRREVAPRPHPTGGPPSGHLKP